MFQLLLILIIVCIVIAIRRIRRQPPNNRPKLILRYGLYGVAIIAIILVITGRLHWVAAAITALFPILQRLLPIVLRILPFIKKPQQHTGSPPPASPASAMTIEQALKILGLSETATEQDIIQRHRELMQKNHPDRGGSDFLAAQINEAKDRLLRHKKNNV